MPWTKVGLYGHVGAGCPYNIKVCFLGDARCQKDYGHCDLILFMNPIRFHRDVHTQARCILSIELFIDVHRD